MLNISKGIVLRPQKVVVYGPEGIGKSTFASHFPDPLFLDIEDSTSQLDVKRIPDINSWAMLLGIIADVKNEKPCNTLVIDTVDWAEKLCIQYVCAQAKKSSIEDFGLRERLYEAHGSLCPLPGGPEWRNKGRYQRGP